MPKHISELTELRPPDPPDFLRRTALNLFILSSGAGIFPQEIFFLTIHSHKIIFCLAFFSGASKPIRLTQSLLEFVMKRNFGKMPI